MFRTYICSCGKATPSLVGLLSIYFSPLLPPGSADMEVSQTIQTAALQGLGLLYMQSANRWVGRGLADMEVSQTYHTDTC